MYTTAVLDLLEYLKYFEEIWKHTLSWCEKLITNKIIKFHKIKNIRSNKLLRENKRKEKKRWKKKEKEKRKKDWTNNCWKFAMRGMKVTMISITIGAIWRFPYKQEENKQLENRRIEINLSTKHLRSVKIIRRILDIRGDLLSLKLQWKPSVRADVRKLQKMK